jgi:hypothetical protein
LKKTTSTFALVIAIAALIVIARPASAHVGSPNVFYEGDAGPYHLFVTVRVPQVIPGVADIEIRASSDNVRQISTAVATLTGPGSKYVPVPDVAKRSKVDPRYFTSSLWLMASGSMRVLLKVNGARGPAEMSVPVPAFATGMLPMPKWLGAMLLILALGLAVGAISIVRAAARESRVEPGAPVPPHYQRSGRRATIIMTVLVAAIFFGAFHWWNSDAQNYAAIATYYKGPKLTATLSGADRITIRPTDEIWLRYEKVDEMVPDHGHVMHLFLVRTPGIDRIWHLHPERTDKGSFEENLPSMEPGHYKVFADLVDKSGFPWTLVGTIDLPNVQTTPMSGDDSEGIASPVVDSSDTISVTLADGTKVTWKRDTQPIKANAPMFLQFQIDDQTGKPASDLEPYMGMAAHAEIIRSDLSVFAHIHPSGSVPMASLMMASADTTASSPMAGMEMPTDKVSPELSLPYGFPKPGQYRIFLQFKRAGHIDTAAFDTHVQ